MWGRTRWVDLSGGMVGAWGGRTEAEPWSEAIDPFRLPPWDEDGYPPEIENVADWIKQRGGASFSRMEAAAVARRCGLLDQQHKGYSRSYQNHRGTMFQALDGLEYYDQIRSFILKGSAAHHFIVNPGLLASEAEPVGSAVYRRLFNHDQKRELWFAAGGRCGICRVRLGSDWHADHVIPWSKGGLTIVSNGMALCPECNHRKHAKL
jgi:5-methylcytosine-specific restriction endonuclease McrA